MCMTDDDFAWPAEKLSALRLGRRLAVGVPASEPVRRAFVSITPIKVAQDEQAQREGWTRRGEDRSFRVEQWEYEADRVERFDYDVGAVLVLSTLAVGGAAADGASTVERPSEPVPLRLG